MKQLCETEERNRYMQSKSWKGSNGHQKRGCAKNHKRPLCTTV